MKQETNLQCIQCKSQTKIVFKKPDHFTPTTECFVCPNEECGFEYLYRISKKTKEQVLVQLKIIRVGNKKVETHALPAQ